MIKDFSTHPIDITSPLVPKFTAHSTQHTALAITTPETIFRAICIFHSYFTDFTDDNTFSHTSIWNTAHAIGHPTPSNMGFLFLNHFIWRKKMKNKREIAVSRTAMTNGAFTAMTKGLAALLMALALVFTFASCKTESEEETVYRTVTYSTEHATAPEKLTVTDGTALTAEQLPALTESGYTFGGWYDGETKAEAGYKVTKDVTLTAKWTAISGIYTENGTYYINVAAETAPADGNGAW